MPEKVNLSRLIIKVSSLLSFFTSFFILGLILYSRAAFNLSKEIRQISGIDFLTSRGLVILAVTLIFGLLGWMTSSGITKKKRWSWVSSFIIAIILILLFPLGTILGIKLLLSLLSPEVKGWLGWRQPAGASGPKTDTDAEAHFPEADLEPFPSQEEEQNRDEEDKF